MRWWWRTGQILAGLLAPPVCALCGGPGQQQPGEIFGLDLCEYCEAACPRAAPGCPRCAEPPADLPCRRCGADPPAFDATHALFRYADPVDRMITALKFHGDLAFARVLGTLLARELAGRELRPPHCLVPLPLHPARYRERGFSQTMAIAAHVAPRLRIPVDAGLLCRRRATLPQSGLAAAARAANLQGAFAVTAGRIPPPRVALLDDVMTTAHTAAAAAAALKAAAAARCRSGSAPAPDGGGRRGAKPARVPAFASQPLSS